MQKKKLKYIEKIMFDQSSLKCGLYHEFKRIKKKFN